MLLLVVLLNPEGLLFFPHNSPSKDQTTTTTICCSCSFIFLLFLCFWIQNLWQLIINHVFHRTEHNSFNLCPYIHTDMATYVCKYEYKRQTRYICNVLKMFKSVWEQSPWYQTLKWIFFLLRFFFGFILVWLRALIKNGNSCHKLKQLVKNLVTLAERQVKTKN